MMSSFMTPHRPCYSRTDLLSSVLLIASVVLPEAQKSMKAKPLVGILKSFIQKHQNKDLAFRAQSGTDNPKKGMSERNTLREVSSNILE